MGFTQMLKVSLRILDNMSARCVKDVPVKDSFKSSRVIMSQHHVLFTINIFTITIQIITITVTTLMQSKVLGSRLIVSLSCSACRPH